MKEIAEGVVWVPITMANAYFIGDPGKDWFLVDTGTPGSAKKIVNAAEARYGEGSKPRAILLTHGHFDHSGNALALAQLWNVPIYVHPKELPFVTGLSAYPPYDPTIGGAMALLSRLIPRLTLDLRNRVQVLPYEGHIPELPDWEWLPTPGHTPGHVSFWRAKDRTLLAGDALATVDLDSFYSLMVRKQTISRPPSPMTCDWGAAKESVELLADKEPFALACGHGVPMCGEEVAGRFQSFVDYFPMPSHGRYVFHPAITDAEGIAGLPPAPEDPVKRVTAVMGAAALIGLLAVATVSLMRNSSKNRES